MQEGWTAVLVGVGTTLPTLGAQLPYVDHLISASLNDCLVTGLEVKVCNPIL